jgi:GT2 family glycosyltransferase
MTDEYLTCDEFMVSRAVLDKIGMLDPMSLGYFVDNDYGLLARLAGCKLFLKTGRVSNSNTVSP